MGKFENLAIISFFKHGTQLIILLGLLLSLGCSQPLLKPSTPQTIITNATSITYPINEFTQNQTDYLSAVNSNDLSLAQRIRDRMINRIRADIEANYRDYETQFFAGQAAFHVIADSVELALSLATTVAGDKGTKTVLGAILTAAKGERLSYDKNFFREKTSELIISKMQANRDRVKARILDKMTHLSVDEYTFEEAIVDLVELFHAGTLQGAIVALTNDTGKDATDAKQEANDVEVFRTKSAAQVASVRTMRDGLNKLFKAWQSAKNNAAVADPLLLKAKNALKLLGVTFSEQDSGKTLFDRLNKQITQARTEKDTDAYLTKLSNAFRTSEIIE